MLNGLNGLNVLNVGIIGYGAIGKPLLQAIKEQRAGAVRCPAVLVRRAQITASEPVELGNDADRFLQQDLDVIVECAGHAAVRSYGERILQQADFLVTSVGALTDDELLIRLRKTAKNSGHKLILPSAGIGALDTLTAAATGALDNVKITVRKQTDAWYDTPAEQLVDLSRLSEAVTVYEGPVREGARLYPGNVNISAAVALAGIGLDKTQLQIIADPTITTHIIEVEASGEFGRFHFLEDVIPEPDNPKTGKIVAMALIKSLRQMSSELQIGA